MIGRTSLTFLGTLALWLLTSTAFAHDHWINHGNYKSPYDGVHCCGKDDCDIIPSSQVRIGKYGYDLTGYGEFVFHKDMLISEDSNYWRCRKPNGTLRCFFAPTQAF